MDRGIGQKVDITRTTDANTLRVALDLEDLVTYLTHRGGGEGEMGRGGDDPGLTDRRDGQGAP